MGAPIGLGVLLAPESRASAFCQAHFDSASYCALHFGLAWDFFCCRHAMTLAMLVSEPLQSLNASPLQADCNAADGAKPADASPGDTSRAKPIAAGIIQFRTVFMNLLLSHRFDDEIMSLGERSAVTMIT